jgi:hypothetical protein
MIHFGVRIRAQKLFPLENYDGDHLLRIFTLAIEGIPPLYLSPKSVP